MQRTENREQRTEKAEIVGGERTTMVEANKGTVEANKGK